jgi:hypothetical protein
MDDDLSVHHAIISSGHAVSLFSPERGLAEGRRNIVADRPSGRALSEQDQPVPDDATAVDGQTGRDHGEVPLLGVVAGERRLHFSEEAGVAVITCDCKQTVVYTRPSGRQVCANCGALIRTIPARTTRF